MNGQLSRLQQVSLVATSVIALVLVPGLSAGQGPARAAARLSLRTSEGATAAAALAAPDPPPAGNASPAADDNDVDDVEYEEFEGGARNYIIVLNRQDERFRMRAKVQLNQIPAERVAPENFASAGSQCVDCKTMAVALQINLYRRSASYVAPVNQAFAYNYQCTRCMTKARAIQYVLPVDDPTDVPPSVRRLVVEMNRELREIARDARSGNVTFDDAEYRVNGVISQFHDLAWHLSDQRDEKITPDAR